MSSGLKWSVLCVCFGNCCVNEGVLQRLYCESLVMWFKKL